MRRRAVGFTVAGLFVVSVGASLIGPGPRPDVQPASGGLAPHAYVVGSNGLVHVVDTAKGVVLSTANTSGRPTGVAVAPDGNRVYVINGWSGSITLVDPRTGAVLDRLHTEAQLAGAVVRPDGQRLYVTGSAGASGVVVVVDPESFQLTTVIRVGGQPQGIAVSPDGRRLYVANGQDGTVSVLDTETASPVATIGIGGLPQQVTVSPDGGRVYVSSMRFGDAPSTVSVIDAEHNAVITSIPVGKSAGSLAVTPDGARVYVALTREQAIAVLDTATRTVLKTLLLGATGVAITPGDRRVFLATGSTTTVLDSTDDAVLSTFDLGAFDLGDRHGRGFEATAIAFASTPS